MVAGRYFGRAIILIATPEPGGGAGPNQQPPFLPLRGLESAVGGVGAKDIIKPLFSLLKGNGKSATRMMAL